MESLIEVIAEVHLLTAAESGKTCGYKSGVRPNHVFAGQQSSIAGDIRFEDKDELELRATTIAQVRLLYPKGFPELAVGTTWRIHEGSRHVGNARVLQILSVAN